MKSKKIICFLFLLAFWFSNTDVLRSQCLQNIVLNQGFEEVTLPCGPVPPNGLINGSFNMGCMTGWEAAWGSPSVCASNPYEGDYYCCLGANNEAVFQNLSLCAGGIYELSFYYRRLVGSAGNLRVFMANGLVNVPISNSGNPPLQIQGSWQELANVPVNNSSWQFFINPEVVINDPANFQLLFLLVPPVDIGFDDIVFRLVGKDPEITCSSTNLGTYTVSGSVPNPPNGYTITSWEWDFGDGSSGNGQTVTHTYSVQGTYEVCLTTTDQCGCQRQVCTTIIYNDCSCNCEQDMVPPVVITPFDAFVQVSCLSDAPPPPALQIQDNCDTDPVIIFSESIDGPPCNETIFRQWEVSDLCGNTILLNQTIQVLDDIPPEMVQDPSNLVVSCPNPGGAFLDWVSQNGGGVSQDNCGEVTWTAIFDSIPQYPCGGTEVLFTVTDQCLNTQEFTMLFLVEDTQPPNILAFPEDLVVFCQSGIYDTLQSWLSNHAGGIATDECGPVTWTNNFNGDTSQQVIPVLFTVSDLCGNMVNLPASFIHLGGNDTVYQSTTTCDPLQISDTVLVQQSGCQSWVITSYQLQPSDTFLIETFTCDPLMVGQDTLVLSNQFGCDSLVIHVREFMLSDTTLFLYTTCNPALVGIDTLVLVNQLGCDSLVITQTSLLPSNEETQTIFICDPQMIGLDTLFLTNQYGCDSIVYLEKEFSGIFQEESQVTLCGPGISYIDTLVVTGGPCDSLFITQFTYFPTDSIWQTTTTCDLASAGIQQVVLQNQFGCDSTLYLEVIYMGIDTQFVQNLSCDSAQVGMDLFIIPGVYCDTITVVETQWAPFSLTFETIYSCDAAGPVADTTLHMTTSGCDSLHIVQYAYTNISGQTLILDERCAGEQNGQLMLSGINGGLPPYQYQLNGSSWQQDTIFTGLAPGNYTLTIRDDRGCTRSYSGLTVQNGQVLTVEAGPDQIVVPGAFIDLSAQATVAIQEWLWVATDPLSCATCSQTILGSVNSAQTVFLSVLSALGCPASDMLQVTLSAPSIPEVFIPSSFSPNGDGINDVFSVYGNDQVRNVRNLAVYDRWGNALYTRADLPVNDPSQGWDGNFRDKLMDPGVYVYVIEVELTDGTERLYKGDVMLMR